MTLIASVAVAWLSISVQTLRTRKRTAPATFNAMGAATNVSQATLDFNRLIHRQGRPLDNAFIE